MKKITAVLLALGLVAGLSACSNNSTYVPDEELCERVSGNKECRGLGG